VCVLAATNLVEISPGCNFDPWTTDRDVIVAFRLIAPMMAAAVTPVTTNISCVPPAVSGSFNDGQSQRFTD
jgi:hypothetical protein